MLKQILSEHLWLSIGLLVSYLKKKHRTEVIETRKRRLNSYVEPITNIKPDNPWPTLNRIIKLINHKPEIKLIYG